MLLPTPDQSLTKTRADFRIQEFRKLIKQKGLVLTWQQTIDCPCNIQTSVDGRLDLLNVVDIDAQKGGHRSDCNICGGSGLIRHSEQDIKAIVTKSEGEEIVEKHGLLRIESINLTLEPEHLPSYGDRFVLKDSVIVWREVLVMPAGGTLTTTKPIVERTLTLQTGDSVVGVLYIQTTDSTGQTIIAAQIPDTDYTINANGSITFTNAANAPAEGTRVAISYYTNPSYVVSEYPHTLRDTFIREKSIEVFSPMLVQCKAKMDIAKK